MTINLTETHIYIVIILFLIGIQIYQGVLIKKLQKENSDLWQQTGTVFLNVTNFIMELQKSLERKQDK